MQFDWSKCVTISRWSPFGVLKRLVGLLLPLASLSCRDSLQRKVSNPVIVLAVLMTTPEHNLHSLGHLNRLVYEKLLGALYHKDLLSPEKARLFSGLTSTMQWTPLQGIRLIANYKIHHISAQILVKICTYHVIRMLEKSFKFEPNLSSGFNFEPNLSKGFNL
jgi:hypothetical protein